MKNLKVVLGLSLNAVLFVLSYMVPKRKGTILLGGGLGHRFSGNPKYFYLYLCCEYERGQRSFQEISWITKNRKVWEQLRAQDRRVLNSWSLPGFWSILRSEYLVIESGHARGLGGHDIGYERLFLGRFNVIQTWHGSPLKRICLDALRDRALRKWHEIVFFWLYKKELSSLWCIVALSNVDRQKFLTAFENERIAITGYPKNDVFFSKPQKWNIKTQWDAYSKVILYAPTFRDHDRPVKPFTEDFLLSLNDTLREKQWCLLLKKHQFDETITIPENVSNIINVSERVEEIQDILVETDILITDYSSVFVDFLLRKKPIIFYTYDINEYLSESRQLYVNYFDEIPGPFAHTQDELSELLQNVDCWFLDEIYQRKLEDIRNKYHMYKDGSACKRLESLLTHGSITSLS